MKISQVAAQLYTLKGLTETPSEIVSAMRRVRAMGYEAVQVSGLGPIDETDLAKILLDEGLICCATHEQGDSILGAPERVAERLNRLDCAYTAYPYPAGIDFNNEESINGLIRSLNAAGRVLMEAGKTLCYHNHHVEFRKLDGRVGLDRIYDGTDPNYLQGELDIYWVQYGGGDPLKWCRKLKGRQPLIHLKDYMIDADNKPQYADIGAGTLDIPAIVAEAEAGGCEWFIVERDPAPGDPFDSLKASYEYLREAVAEQAAEGE